MVVKRPELFIWLLLEPFAKDFDLLLNFHPKLKMLQINIVAACGVNNANPFVREIDRGNSILILTGAIVTILRTLVACDGKQSCDKGLLHIRKAELVRNVSNSFAQLIRELDSLVVCEFGLPEMAVGDALFEIGVGEQVFAIEA